MNVNRFFLNMFYKLLVFSEACIVFCRKLNQKEFLLKIEIGKKSYGHNFIHETDTQLYMHKHT